MDLERIDLNTLRKLRGRFLAQDQAGQADYWTDPEVLDAYDRTFAARIGWKWDWVLDELDRLGWVPPGGTLLDFGCGTGIATRRVLARFGPDRFERIALLDRSRAAMAFAARRLVGALDSLDGRVCPGQDCHGPDLLLVSHVAGELDNRQLQSLLDRIARATATIWVEPGTWPVSQKLIAARQILGRNLAVIAPCPHQGPCRLASPANRRHWCHFFARPPAEIFMDANWIGFGREMGIDLRSLPVSFLALDARGPVSLPEEALRVLGRVRTGKAHLQLFGCDATGTGLRRLMKRHDKDAFRLGRKGKLSSLLSCRYGPNRREILQAREIQSAGSGKMPGGQEPPAT